MSCIIGYERNDVMNIQPIVSFTSVQPRKLNAKSQNSCAFRGDPDYSTSTYGSYSYRDDYWKKEIRLPDRFKRLTRATVGNPVTDERMKDFLINSFKDIGNNCYKGGLTGASDYVKELNECGIKKFIMLCEPEETRIMEKCEKFGVPLEIVHMPDYELNTEAQIREFRSKFSAYSFVNAVKALREGNCFVGCESGNIRTKKFLSVVQTLDPECKLNVSGLRQELEDIKIAKIIYRRLSDEMKKSLGYTEQFEKKLLEALKWCKV